MGFLPWDIRVPFPGESQLRQSRATKPTVHAGCLSVSIIRRNLPWTTGFLACAQMLEHAIAQGCVRTHVNESALKADSGKKIPCRTGESNLRDETDDEISHWPVTKRTDRWRRRSCYRSLLVILGVSTCRSFPGNNSSNIELVSDRDGRYVNCYQWYTGCHDHSLGGNCRYVNG